ncbi:MAG TPA: flagellar M-ring protein FliF [Clostridiales bacterium]|nr:MAG: flagellar M-ring protein FliF [Clostridiales bacterium GWD2_32_19]HCC07611.1 flagellar M-ring protein FliF [Clostridiales bacterium]
MGETFERMLQQVTEKWNQVDRGEKIKLSLIVIVILAILGIAVFMFTKSSYVRLTDEQVSYKTMGEIKTVLDSNKITYELSEDGQGVMVNKKDLAKARIAVSTENILGSEYSWSEFSSENMMGLTETEKKYRYKKLKEEELVGALKKIEGVSDAIVKLTIPEDSPFVTDEKKTAKAGVQLSLSRALTKKEVMGVANFVAASVEDLSINNVSISDTSPSVLFSGEEMNDPATGNLSKYDEVRTAKENEVQNKVKALLSPMYDDVTVTANLKINFDKYKETNEKVSSPFEGGKKGIPITEQIQTTANESGAGTAEPGYESNSGTTDYLTGSTDTSKSTSENTSTTYAVNKTVSEMEKSTGDALLDESSLSVIVWRTKAYDYSELNKQGLLKDTTWKDYVTKIQSTTTTLVLDTDIVDLIKKGTGISDVKITGYEKPVFIEEAKFDFPIQEYIPVIIIIMAILMFAFYLIRKTKSAAPVHHSEPELSVEQMLVSTRSRNGKNADGLPEIHENDSETKRRIEDFIEQKPQLVAQLLKNWIAEDWE